MGLEDQDNQAGVLVLYRLSKDLEAMEQAGSWD
jgi:hypothetical protein